VPKRDSRHPVVNPIPGNLHSQCRSLRWLHCGESARAMRPAPDNRPLPTRAPRLVGHRAATQQAHSLAACAAPVHWPRCSRRWRPPTHSCIGARPRYAWIAAFRAIAAIAASFDIVPNDILGPVLVGSSVTKTVLGGIATSLRNQVRPHMRVWTRVWRGGQGRCPRPFGWAMVACDSEVRANPNPHRALVTPHLGPLFTPHRPSSRQFASDPPPSFGEPRRLRIHE